MSEIRPNGIIYHVLLMHLALAEGCHPERSEGSGFGTPTAVRFSEPLPVERRFFVAQFTQSEANGLLRMTFCVV